MKVLKLLLLTMLISISAFSQTTPWNGTPAVTWQTRTYSGEKQIRALFGTSLISFMDSLAKYNYTFSNGLTKTGNNVILGGSFSNVQLVSNLGGAQYLVRTTSADLLQGGVLYAHPNQSSISHFLYTSDFSDGYTSSSSYGDRYSAIGVSRVADGISTSIEFNNPVTPLSKPAILVTDDVQQRGLVGKGYYGVTADDNTYIQKKFFTDRAVTLTDNQTITGSKTFTPNITVNGISFGAGLNASSPSNDVYIGDTPSAGATGTFTSNTGVGRKVFASLTTGTINTTIGYNSWNLLTNGGSNVGLGVNAGRYRNGSFNVAIGTNALQGASPGPALGSYNIGIGTSVFSKNSGGSSNTGIGDRAGENNLTGSGNLFLGYNAGQNETGSNKLYIANTNTSTPLIQGDFSSSTININGKLSTTVPPSTPNDVVRLADLSSRPDTTTIANTYAKKDSVIKNQTTVTQNAKFKISGDGTVGKSFVGDTTRMIQLFVKGTSITRAVGSANIIEADSGYVYKTGILKGLYTYGNGLSGRHTQAISGTDSSFYSTRNSIPVYKPGNYLMFELLVNDAISDSTIYTPATFRVQMDSVVMAAISRKGWPANHLILANTAYFNPPTALTFPNTEYRYSLFAAQMQAEATARGVLIYDDYAAFKTLYTADNTLLFTDILHPTPKGHTVIAQRFSAWLNTYISTLNIKTPISREAGTKELYGDLIVRQNANVYNVNVINDLKTNSIMSPNALPIVIPSPLNTTVDVQTGTDNAAGRAFMANNVIYTGMGISTSVANWKARFNSRGVALSSVTTSGGLFMMGTTTPNNTTTFKPEISAWRAAGTRIYPEFTFRQHSTADLGFELLAGNGVRTPRILLTGEYGVTASKVKVADSTILNIVKLPATSTQGSLLVRNTSGDVEQVQITGLIKGNGPSAPTAAVANTDYIAPTRTITTTSPLTGGGDLSANRTFGLAGLTGLGTANQIVGMNAAATAYEYKTVTGGNGVSITQGVGSVTISATGNPIVEITGTAQTAAANTIYIPHNAAVTTISIPTTTVIGSLYQVIGEGAGGWKFQFAAGQTAKGVGVTTTSGGSIASTDRYCTLTVRLVSANTFVITTSQGTLTPL